jgi:hypothetical protein
MFVRSKVFGNTPQVTEIAVGVWMAEMVFHVSKLPEAGGATATVKMEVSWGIAFWQERVKRTQ